MLKTCSYQVLQGDPDIDIESIAYHSDRAREGSVFVCIKGAVADGHDYAAEAAIRGAKAVICQKPIKLPTGKEDVTVILTEDSRKTMARMAAEFYGNPADRLKLIAITGTKGKTTTACMIQAGLKESGIKTGLIGTLYIDTGKRIIESTHTTPESVEIQSYLREMAEWGCQAAVLEVSSQALMLARTEGLFFDRAVFTNIEEDHIGPGEHRDFAEYAYWKSTLFKRCAKAFVNGDDPHLDVILSDCRCPVVTFGFSPKNSLWGYDFDSVRLPGKLGVELSVKGDYNINLVIGMAGRFTCYNAMAAAAVLKDWGCSDDTVCKALREIQVPGRQEMFDGGGGRVTMVDYAHNGTALISLLRAIKAYQPKKVICLFGCGGRRDRQRRFSMGKAATEYADFIIVTTDNPRDEEPMAIIDDIVSAVEKAGGNYMVIPDRKEAIDYAVAMCNSGEIAVIAGKGHESYQIIGDKRTHFDDREQVLAAIEKVKHEKDYFGRN